MTIFKVRKNNSFGLSAFLCGTLAAGAASPSASAQPEPQIFSPVPLRGYGTLSGEFTRAATPRGASLLQINFVHEFDYAKEQQRAGFVFWNDMLANDTTEGRAKAKCAKCRSAFSIRSFIPERGFEAAS